jgi:hypothetical protein
MLKEIFGHKREKVIGGWRKLHNGGVPSFSLFRKYY